MPALRYAVLTSPLGPLYTAFGEQGLIRLAFGRRLREADFARSFGTPAERVEPARHGHARQLAAELGRYFAGAAEPFTTQLDWTAATPFQRRVWAALRQIPFGETAAYGDIARRVGSPGGARAVGQAVGANPFPILIPCHRVIRSSGALGGFSAGLPLKRWLLAHERRRRGA